MPLRLHYNLEKVSMGLVAAIIVAASIGGIGEIVKATFGDKKA